MTFDLETQAYRCFASKEVECDDLVEFFKELGYERIPSDSTEVYRTDWPDADKNQVIDAKFIVKKDDFKICCLVIKSDNESVWKRIANRIIKSLNGDCLVLSRNPTRRKWIFSSLSQKYSDKFSETRNAPLEFATEEQNIQKSFLEFFKKITAEEDDVTTTITRKISDAFDNLAIQIHNELTANVYEALKTLSNGIIEEKSNNLELNEDTLKEIRSPIFILLYRLIFILYAEDREIFPVDNKIYYEEFSLKWIKEEWLLKTTNTKLAEYKVQKRLKDLFKLITHGSDAFAFPKEEFFMRSYYGRLFDSEINSKLEIWKISNSHLIKTLELLTRTKDKKGNYFFLDYAALNTRHLGAVYEHLLESHLEIKNNKIQKLTEAEGERKTSGSYYTPKNIVDYIVQNSIEPLIDKIINENPDKQIQIEKILELKILDPAMGSGHFLVGAVEYIAKRICKIEFGEITEQAYIDRKRDVVRRCIYGVDINPLAVDLASLSLWLETLSSEKPLSFLQSHLKCGNSLIGNEIESIFGEHDIHSKTTQTTLFESQGDKDAFKKNIRNFIMFENLEDDTVSKVRVKLEEYAKMQTKGTIYKNLQFRLNCKTAESFGIELPILYENREIGENSLDGYTDEEQQKIISLSIQERFFHWELEFPQIFYDENAEKKSNPGFDCIIANPPYVDSEHMTKTQKKLREILSKIFSSTEGNWDLYIPFFEQSAQLCKNNGIMCLISPNKWLAIGYGHSLRSLLSKNLLKLTDCSAVNVFGAEAANSPVIITFKKQDVEDDIKIDSFSSDYNILKMQSAPRKILELDNWGIMISKYINILLRIMNQEKRLLDYDVKVENPFIVSEAYKLLEMIYDGKDSEKNFKLINTGTIDPFITLWGKKNTTYIKHKFLHPYVDRKKLEKTMPKRFDQSRSPKLIITGMRYFQVFLDEEGKYVAGKSTMIIRNSSKISVKALNALLNSRLIRFYLQEAYKVTGIDGGVNFNAGMIEQTPTPKLSQDIITVLEKFNDKILKCNTQDEVKLNKILEELNEFIYDIYKLNKDDILVISNACK